MGGNNGGGILWTDKGITTNRWHFAMNSDSGGDQLFIQNFDIVGNPIAWWMDFADKGVGLYNSAPTSGSFEVGTPEIIDSTLTVVGNAFSVGGSTFDVVGSSVGIRTSVPATALDVNGSAQFGVGVNRSSFTSTGNLQLVSGSTITSNGTLTISTAASAATATANMILDSNGRVGISTNSPSNQMEIDTNTAVSVDSQLALKLFNRTNDLSGLAIGRGGGTNWDIYRYGSSGSDNFCIGQFGISEVECLTTAGNATFSGNVHLGTTTGTQMFRCVGGADAGWLLYGNSGAAQTLCTGGGGSLTGTGVFLP